MNTESVPAQAVGRTESDSEIEFDLAEANLDLTKLPAAQQLAERGSRFVCWRWEAGDKIPKRTNGINASSTNPASWASLGQCMAAVEEHAFSGIGFVLAAERDLEAGWLPIVGIDLDSCIDLETGEVAAWARQIVDDFATYTEVSPSGTGLKLFFMVEKTHGLRGGKFLIRKTNGHGHDEQVEIFATARYFAVTWDHLEGTPDELAISTEAYERLISRLPLAQDDAEREGHLPVELGDCRSGPSAATLEVIERTAWIRELWHQGKGHGSDPTKSALDHELALQLGKEGVANEEVGRALLHFPHGQFGAGKLKDVRRRLTQLVGVAQARRVEALAKVEPVKGLVERIQKDAQEAKESRFAADPAADASDGGSAPAGNGAASGGNSPTGDFVPLDFASLAGRKPPARRFVLDGIMPVGCVTSLYGYGGIGKSMLAQEMAACVATGDSRFGFKVAESGPVVGIFTEDDHDELWRRQCRINTAGGWSEDGLDRLHIQGRAGLENTLAIYSPGGSKTQPLLATVRGACEFYQPKLLILDNIAQLFGGNENDRFQVSHFCNILAGLARVFDCAVLLLGHPAKSEDSEYSGTTGWDAAVRSRLLMLYIEEQLLLKMPKANYAEKGEVGLVWQDGVLQFLDGEAVTDNTPIRGFMDDLARKIFLEALDALSRQQVWMSPNLNAPKNYAPRVILERKLGQGLKKEQLAEAMGQLIEAGEIAPNAKLAEAPGRRWYCGLKRLNAAERAEYLASEQPWAAPEDSDGEPQDG